jgi:hypothetical protein
MNYSTANDRLSGRNSERRKVDNNTYLERRQEGKIAIRLHSTDIIIFHPSGDIELNTGGWQTVTTKDRLNEFLPGWRVWSNKGVWYVGINGNTFPYADGMILHEDGTVDGQGEDPSGVAKLKRRIAKFAKEYMEAFVRGEVPAPSGGDCWYCCMRTEKVDTVPMGTGFAKVANHPSANGKGATLGEAFGDVGHLQSHMEEKYYVPSLLANAIQRFRVSPAAMWLVGSKWDSNADPATRESAFRAGLMCRDQLQRSLRRYITEQFGMQA